MPISGPGSFQSTPPQREPTTTLAWLLEPINTWSKERKAMLIVAFILYTYILISIPHYLMSRGADVAVQIEEIENEVLDPVDAMMEEEEKLLDPEVVSYSAVLKATGKLREDLMKKHQGGIRGEYFYLEGMPFLATEHALRERFKRALLLRSEITFGVVGSSNSAGHDNEYNQSWPVRLRELLLPVFAAGGVGIDVRNAAIGNTKTVQQVFCLEALIGDDVDVVLWEYLMNDAAHPDQWMSWYDTWIRQALLLPSQPVSNFVHVKGGRRAADFKNKPNLKDSFGNILVDQNGNLRPRSGYPPRDTHLEANVFKELRDHYTLFGQHNLFMDDMLWLKDTEKGLRYEDLFITFHPGPQGHQLIADTLAFYYGTILQQAAEEISFLYRGLLLDAAGFAAVDDNSSKAIDVVKLRADIDAYLGDQSEDQLRQMEKAAHLDAIKMYRHAPVLPLPDPMPNGCEEPFCSTRANCAISFEPRFGPVSHGLTSRASNATGGSWQWRIPEGEHLHPEKGYLDKKVSLYGNSTSGKVQILTHVPAGAHGLLILCQSPLNWGKPVEGWKRLQDDVVHIAVDEVEVNKKEALENALRICKSEDFLSVCMQLDHDVPVGDHTVTVWIDEEPGAKVLPHVYLSHLIAA